MDFADGEAKRRLMDKMVEIDGQEEIINSSISKT